MKQIEAAADADLRKGDERREDVLLAPTSLPHFRAGPEMRGPFSCLCFRSGLERCAVVVFSSSHFATPHQWKKGERKQVIYETRSAPIHVGERTRTTNRRRNKISGKTHSILPVLSPSPTNHKSHKFRRRWRNFLFLFGLEYIQPNLAYIYACSKTDSTCFT